MLSRLFFGDDVFISYSRADGSLYAAGLADELTKRKFSCFIDQLGTDPDRDLPATLKSKLRNSTMCVLVGTQRALTSEAVRKEIEEFKKTRRTIVPVFFDGVPEQSPLSVVIPGLARATEQADKLLTGNPSPSVINRVEKSFNYTRRNQRMRRLALGTVAAVVLLLGGTVGVSAMILRRAQVEAEDARRAAQEAQVLANERLERATKAEADANAARNQAQKLLKEAQASIAQSQYNAMKAAQCCERCP